MSASRRDALRKHVTSFFDQIHPETDIPTIVALVGLTADQRHFVMAESGINRKWRFFDHLSHSVGDIENWNGLIGFLEETSRADIAGKLTSNGQFTEQDDAKSNTSSVDVFSQRLAQHYQQHYAHLSTMGESPKHVKDVWVPLQLDGRNEDHLDADRIDHVAVLKRLKSAEGRNVAIIKGDPGMGKTKLAKKIAYDWATNYGSNKPQPFCLILAVPLRYVGKSSRLDQMSIDYFLSAIDTEGIDKELLVREINQLNYNLLVILDGLDEYRSYDSSPFKVLFAPPFQYTSPDCNTQPPIIHFKLLITSRPYACENINEEFWPLRFVILPLDNDHVGDFVQLYCQTSHGAAKVMEHLKTNVKLVIQVPLILMFVCYLADFVEEIPTNMTSLYDSFIRQMLRREHRRNKLSESFAIQKWKDSNIVRTTGELAYQGSVDDTVEFSTIDMDKCHVTNDSFANDTVSADFPHRSIQEFFTAYHCCQMMLSGNDLRSQVSKLITTRDSLVGRFFFGICSKEAGQFVQMTNWLSPSLLFSEGFLFRPAMLISGFGVALADCSAEDNDEMGKTLLKSIRDIDVFVSSARLPEMPVDISFTVDQLSEDFKKEIRLGCLAFDEKGLTSDWCLGGEMKSPRLVCVFSKKLPELLAKEFEQIDILVMGYMTNALLRMDNKVRFAQLKSLPPVGNLLLTTGSSSPSETICIIVSILYRRNGGLKLTRFRFEYLRNERDELLSYFINEQPVDLTVDERGEFEIDETMTSRKLKVTVNDDGCQATLIPSLIRISLLEGVGNPAAFLINRSNIVVLALFWYLEQGVESHKRCCCQLS